MGKDFGIMADLEINEHATAELKCRLVGVFLDRDHQGKLLTWRRRTVESSDDDATPRGPMDFMTMLAALIESNFQASQQIRQIQGVCLPTWMLTQNYPLVKAAKEAGAIYDAAAKASGPGH